MKGGPTWYQRNPKEREPLASRDVMKGSCLAAVRTRVSFIAADIGLSWSNSTNERYKEEPVCQLSQDRYMDLHSMAVLM